MCEVMREACAVSMFLLSWKYLVERKWVKYYLLCTAAFLFHSSAVLLFFLPLLKLLKLERFVSLNRWTFVFLILILLLGFFIQQYFFDSLTLIAFTSRIENKIVAYSNSSLSGSIFNIKGILSTAIMYVFYPLMSLYFLKKKYSLSNISYEPMVLLCCIFALLMIPIALLYRYNNYFMLFAIIAISDWAYSDRIHLPKRICLRNLGFAFWILLFLPLFFLKIYAYFPTVGNTQYQEYMRYYPYSSIFSRSINSDREKLFIYYHAY